LQGPGTGIPPCGGSASTAAQGTGAETQTIEPGGASPAFRHELTLYPAPPQLDGKFTEHVGSAVAYTYRLRERVGVQVFGQLNWLADTSDFSRELNVNVREQARPATANLMRWGLTVGSELMPANGTFMLGPHEVRYGGFIAAGAGVAGTRSHLRTDPALGEIHGDTGQRLLAQSALGVTAAISERVAVRIEYRRFFYSSRINKVNGCTLGDVWPGHGDDGGWSRLRPGPPEHGSDSPSTCDRDSMQPSDVPHARALLADGRSDVLHFRHLHAGMSVRF
jgi:hypothetical protein